MKTAEISNGIDITGCISWQYENAPHFVALVKGFNDLFSVISSELWGKMLRLILNIDSANGFGLDIIGMILGFKRPVVSGSSASDDIYRAIIKGKFYMLKSEYSIEDINIFLQNAFGDAVKVEDNLDMTLTYTLLDTSNRFLFELFKPSNISSFVTIFPLPCGVFVKQDDEPTAFIPFGLNDTLTEGQKLSNFNHGGFAQ